MKLYHGSDCIVSEPRCDASRANLDFGRGFYLTSHKAQAEKWALRKSMRSGKPAIVNEFDFDDSVLLKVKRFEENDAEWVDFVCSCRRGGKEYLDYELIVGGVADDRVYQAVDMYYRGLWDMQTTLEALAFYERNDQYCFVNQAAVDKCLAFAGSYEVKR